MGLPLRQRSHSPRRIAVLPAAAALLLLFFLAVSLLFTALSAPPLTGHHGLAASSRRSLRRSSSHAPKSGRTAPDDLWGSKLANNFYVCSNSTSKFLDPSVTTQPDRYLIVVTSGGLNQQRTGTSNPEKGRRQGRWPLTPEEVGLMLRALGYRSHVHIYAASGEIYAGEDTSAPLKALFPNFHTKESLSSEDELTPFLTHSSRMAAIDFIVCDGSDAFVNNNNGNMAKILAGRRRYFGHKRTIRPNAKQIYPLFMNRGNMSWDTFSLQMRIIQKGFMGDPMEVMPGRGEFHANPAACICEKTDQKSVVKLSSRSNQETVNSTEIRKAIGEPAFPIYTDEEVDGSDTEDDPTGRGEMIDTEADDDSLVRREDSELEETLSD